MRKTAAIIMIGVFLSLVSCLNNPALSIPFIPASESHVVTFDANGGVFDDGRTQIEVEVVDGNPVIDPASEPVYSSASHIFAGWCIDKDCTADYDFTSSVTSDITIYAKWDKAEYTVDFILDGVTVHSETVLSGTEINEPDIEVEKGQVVHWYTDQSFSAEVEFPYTVSGNLALYGKKEIATYPLEVSIGNMENVTGFKLVVGDSSEAVSVNGDTYVSEQKYEYGSEIYLFAYIEGKGIKITPAGIISYTDEIPIESQSFAVEDTISGFDGSEIKLNMVPLLGAFRGWTNQLSNNRVEYVEKATGTLSGFATEMNLKTREVLASTDIVFDVLVKEGNSSADVGIDAMIIGYDKEKSQTAEVEITFTDGSDAFEKSSDVTSQIRGDLKEIDISNSRGNSSIVTEFDFGWTSAPVIGNAF